jgi:hypothetical protein
VCSVAKAILSSDAVNAETRLAASPARSIVQGDCRCERPDRLRDPIADINVVSTHV